MWTFCGQGRRGVQMRTSAPFGTNFGFFEICGVFARTRGLSQCGHFTEKGGEQFCADVVYGRPLIFSLLFATITRLLYNAGQSI